MTCGYRAGAGVIGLPVEVTTREPEGNRSRGAGTYVANGSWSPQVEFRACWGVRGDCGVGAVPVATAALVVCVCDAVRCPRL